jgi:hypothetical protein
MNIRPNTSQHDRDMLEDNGLADIPDETDETDELKLLDAEEPTPT